MSEPGARLLDRRVLIVAGKGGVGKTSLTAALGVLAARRGIETVVIETGLESALPPLLTPGDDPPPADDGRVPVRVSDHLHALHIRPAVALAEYLELQLRVRRPIRLLMRNAGFQRLLDAAPGWSELITLGKLWHLESRRHDSGAREPVWGLCIVDAPATGHGLSLLSVPNVVIDSVRMGPLRRHTDAVQALLQDPSRTLVVPVTLPEELPTRETGELVERVRALGIAIGPVIANGVEPAPALPPLDELFSALGGATPRGLPALEQLREIADHALRRRALQAGFLEQLRKSFGDAVLELPQLEGGVETREDVERLADALERELARAESAP